jgi:hypothetical protein
VPYQKRSIVHQLKQCQFEEITKQTAVPQKEQCSQQLWCFKTTSKKLLPTFEPLDVEADCGHNVRMLRLWRHEVVEHGGLARVVEAHNQNVALLLPEAKHVGKLVK